MSQSPETLALEAKTNPQARENFIKSQEQTIIRIASKASYKFITKEDDEWSVALYAFSKAIDSYNSDKGPFLNYASLIIKRDLIDYHRGESKYDSEISVEPFAFSGEYDEEDDNPVQYAVIKNSMQRPETDMQDEIADLSEVLRPFGISFMELVKSSPHQDKTRAECIKVINTIQTNKELKTKLMDKKQLPLSDILKVCNVSRKILDKYRKYIITSAIILTSDFPHLAEYLKPTERRE